MDELTYVYAIAALIVAYFLWQVASRHFDPFAPVWLFLVGYLQVYVIQPMSCHDWAVEVRGQALVAAANCRALWALAWFLAVYGIAPGRRLASMVPRPPRAWSSAWVAVLSPVLVIWGAVCSLMTFRENPDGGHSAAGLLHAFPFWLLVAGILLIVAGRTIAGPRPAFFLPGLACAAAYVLIWMFNGKRSHSLMAVLSTMCALYLTRLRRPSWPALFGTALAGVLVVGIAIGWRNDRDHDRSIGGFVGFLSDFRISTVLESVNLADNDESEYVSYETWEYGGFLLMMDTVPEKSGYDYGANYIRLFSTFIPRLIWHDKPIYGRHAWIGAWIAGSEFVREDDFAGPAIGILGATQLNGGATGTLIVLGVIALVLRTAYEYLRTYADVPWVQFWWAITYYNAWFMVVNDDPCVWFYYNYGISAFPIVVLMWILNRSGARDVAGESTAMVGLS